MKKLDKKGSSLTTTLVIMVILTLIISALLTFSTYSYNRAIVEFSKKRAELLAHSIAETVASELNGDNANDYIPHNSHTDKTVEIISLPEQIKGSAETTLVMDDDNKDIIYIQVKASFNDQNYELQLTTVSIKDVWFKVKFGKIGDVYIDE